MSASDHYVPTDTEIDAACRGSDRCGDLMMAIEALDRVVAIQQPRSSATAQAIVLARPLREQLRLALFAEVDARLRSAGL